MNLTDLEIVKIEAFCADEAMHDAVRKVLLAGLYSHGVVNGESNPLINGAFNLAALSMQNPIPDEQIGAQVRAQFAGLNALENAFKKLVSIKNKGLDVESPYNEAI